MKRRDFLLIAAILAPAIRRASAQQPATKKRLAVIGYGKVEDQRIGRDPSATTFLEELQRLGFTEGANLIIDRWQYQPARREEIAREVVGTNPDVIACAGTPMTLSLKAATTTIPIVTSTGDPVRLGIVSNLARPGGNITGVSVDAGVELWAKRLELLSLAVPKLVNVVFVATEGVWTNPLGQAVRDAAQKLGISLARCDVKSPWGETEYRSAFASIQPDQLDGLILSDEGSVHIPKKTLLIQLIRQTRLPGIFPYPDFVEAGGLMAYAADLKAVIRRFAAQIVEILRGANPGDVPFSQAERFEFVVNLKAAKELGLEMPDGLVASATSIIE